MSTICKRCGRIVVDDPGTDERRLAISSRCPRDEWGFHRWAVQVDA